MYIYTDTQGVERYRGARDRKLYACMHVMYVCIHACIHKEWSASEVHVTVRCACMHAMYVYIHACIHKDWSASGGCT
jgi:hypothetical protein